MNEPNGGGGKKPLAVYTIVERAGKQYWVKIGAAFTNRDGSINLHLDALPVGSNRLQVREQRVWDDARPANGAAAEPAEARP
ncbi:hypothetical protein [Anaeromyxobacter diazotrophicus]|uniref:Uncharacterized protein n=1 Tax=Anaeromyxobacter diazotrophicus TaxID=2590199 RepID=A0A7I9VKQ1_9BACT|nr:hypothetical protein [Anaeromyxobacter diazotrophicus]GEJ56983.1 hypothetical protein AMYX_17240 [Anaeromyxobacter diazotrophicus]